MSDANLVVVIGLGATGLSCVRFLIKRHIPLVVMDTRSEPPALAKFCRDYPQVKVYTGKQWPQEILNQAQTIIVSPGVHCQLPPFEIAKQHGAAIIGDVELFAQHNQVPVIAITGANGKSTVTSLVGEMAIACGKKVAVIGNIGEPVLNVLDNDAQDFDLIVMELSSFQLETTSSLRPLAATVLNITPDHLDRYPSFADYVAAKHRIYHQCANAILNKQDSLTFSQDIPASARQWFFTLTKPLAGEFGLDEDALYFGAERLLAINTLKIVGQHNIANALSALALGYAAGLPMAGMLQALATFTGLAHRCQQVAQQNGVTWINDSKGTNIGACIAAIQGLGAHTTGKMVLLLGGDGKGADFTELVSFVRDYCRAVIVMGKDAVLILRALAQVVPSFQANSMSEAVLLANQAAQEGDKILLSPACSSLDQYRDYAHRGEIYMEAVKGLLQGAPHAG